MADGTGIAGFDATLQLARGCSAVSAGCANCFAMRAAHRLGSHGGINGVRYDGLTQLAGRRPVWTGKVRTAGPEELKQVFGWKKPRRILVGTMGDLFHPEVPDSALASLFWFMGASAGLIYGLYREHRFFLLTKRPKRALTFVRAWADSEDLEQRRRLFEETGHRYDWTDGPGFWPDVIPGVLIGASIEDQAAAETRLPALRAIAEAGCRCHQPSPYPEYCYSAPHRAARPRRLARRRPDRDGGPVTGPPRRRRPETAPAGR